MDTKKLSVLPSNFASELESSQFDNHLTNALSLLKSSLRYFIS